MTAGGTLDAVIPWILIVIAVGWVWWKFQQPLEHLGQKIKGWFASGSDKIQEGGGLPVQRDIIINY